MRVLSAQGLVICTYRRPDRITFLLKYFLSMDALPAHLILVNGHLPGEKSPFPDATALSAKGILVTEVACPPSTPLQRAEGLATLPPEVEIVHFIDDDFIPRTDYFIALSEVFLSNKSIAGAGGVFTQPLAEFSHPKLRRLVGLDALERGRILSTGCTSNGQVNVTGVSEPFEVDWLSGCSMSFRRSVLEKITFPSELQGYAMDEDLIISFQAAQLGKLLVIPAAQGVHDSQKEIRSDKQWFFYSLAARHHAVKFYLNTKTSLTRFWLSVFMRLAWRAWRNKGRPMRWPGFWINVFILLTLNNAPKMDTFRAN